MVGARSISVRLWIWLGAQQISEIATALNGIVISVYALHLHQTPVILAMVLGLKMTGSVIGALLTPWISARLAHRWIMIFSDLSKAGLLVILALSPVESHPALIIWLPLFLGFFQVAFHVSLYTQVPSLVGTEQRHVLNAILASMTGIAVVVGGGLAGSIYESVAPTTIFLVDAATYGLAGLTLLAVQPRAGAWSSDRPAPSRLEALSGDTLKWVAGLIGLLFVGRFIEAFGSATHNVGFPILSRAFNPAEEAFLVGWILAIWGMGKIAAVWVTPALVRYTARHNVSDAALFVVALIITFGFFLGVFLASPLWLIFALAFFAGIFDAVTETVYYGILQNTQGRPTDRLISLSYFIERAGMGLGILATGVAFTHFSTSQVSVLFYGISILAGCVILALMTVSSNHRNGRQS